MRHFREGFHRARHLLEKKFIESEGNNLRETIEHLAFKRLFADIFNAHLTNKNRKIFLGRIKHDDRNA